MNAEDVNQQDKINNGLVCTRIIKNKPRRGGGKLCEQFIGGVWESPEQFKGGVGKALCAGQRRGGKYSAISSP